MRSLVAVAFAFIASAASAQASQPIPAPADPLTAIIHTEDAERFAALWRETNGAPTAAQLQSVYLDRGSYGVSVFTPGRIVAADNLAAMIAKQPDKYRDAVERCLPQVQAANADLRAIYLALKGLLPDAQLPQVYIVVGAGNSGGTASPHAQVLGLEVICAENKTPAAFRSALKHFFAHETVHALQSQPPANNPSPFLTTVLQEGSADFITSLITGEMQWRERNDWAAPREQALWAAFKDDIAKPKLPAERWIYNYQNAPEGWPSDVGYWLGARIWQSYYENASDKHQAVRDMLKWDDPHAILKRSGYEEWPKQGASL